MKETAWLFREPPGNEGSHEHPEEEHSDHARDAPA